MSYMPVNVWVYRPMFCDSNKVTARSVNADLTNLRI